MNTMKALIQAVVERPYDFDPTDFPFHCGIQALIRAAQEVTPQPQELEQAVVHHHVLVSRLSHA